MTYISARTSLFLGLEYLDTIITIVCSIMPFGGDSCRIETSRLVCTAGRLTGFCIVRPFDEGKALNGLQCLFRNAFRRGFLSCRDQSIGLRCQSIDWFLYNIGFH